MRKIWTLRPHHLAQQTGLKQAQHSFVECIRHSLIGQFLQVAKDANTQEQPEWRSPPWNQRIFPTNFILDTFGDGVHVDQLSNAFEYCDKEPCNQGRVRSVSWF